MGERTTGYYTQIGTGNYNEKTARLYTDYSVLTYDQKSAAMLHRYFKLWPWVKRSSKAVLCSSLHCLQNRVLEMIDEQMALAKSGKEAYIGVKINSLTDKKSWIDSWRRHRRASKLTWSCAAFAACSRCTEENRKHPRGQHRRQILGTFSYLYLRQGRNTQNLHRLCGLHDAQHAAPCRGRRTYSKQSPARKSCPPLTSCFTIIVRLGISAPDGIYRRNRNDRPKAQCTGNLLPAGIRPRTKLRRNGEAVLFGRSPARN